MLAGVPLNALFAPALCLTRLACTSPPSGGGETGGGTAPLRVLSFNTGTSLGLDHDGPPEDGYSSADAAISDAWYGNGLAWTPAV